MLTICKKAFIGREPPNSKSMCGVLPDYSAVHESVIRMFVIVSSLVIVRISVMLTVLQESVASKKLKAF